jgi:hypothetical protein
MWIWIGFAWFWRWREIEADLSWDGQTKHQLRKWRENEMPTDARRHQSTITHHNYYCDPTNQ